MTDLRNNILPFGRVLEPDQLSRIYGDTDVYDTPAERARIAASAAISRSEVRKLRLRQAAEIVVMLAVAVFIGFALAVQF